MKIATIKEGLSQFKKVFQQILEDDAGLIIDEAITELTSSKELFDKTKQRKDPKLKLRYWGYKIRPERPLRFRTSKAIDGASVHADIFCDIAWNEEKEPPVQQVIQVRVWSKELAYIHRTDWDAESLFDRIVDQKRVMLRFHFDQAERNQQGPMHHLQFGGNAREEEACWFPEIINLPRINYPPMDLILIGQLIAANFYHDEYKKVRNTPEWIKIVRDSQNSFLNDYYTKCISAINGNDILLDSLWNIT